MTQEALKLALEALDNLMYWDNGKPDYDEAREAITAIKEALAQPEQEPRCGAIIEVFGKDWRLEYMSLPVGKHKLYTQQYTYIAPTHQKPFGWKLVPIEPTNEMLKAMDECSTEGYDERLLAGHASSVYMAAVDVAPTPPQQKQEPVALEAVYETIIHWDEGGGKRSRRELARRIVSLYTTPPQRTWVGLTDEEIDAVTDSQWAKGVNKPIYAAHRAYARAIEAKLKELNS